jgi:hypothetical protein
VPASGGIKSCVCSVRCSVSQLQSGIRRNHLLLSEATLQAPVLGEFSDYLLVNRFMRALRYDVSATELKFSSCCCSVCRADRLVCVRQKCTCTDECPAGRRACSSPQADSRTGVDHQRDHIKGPQRAKGKLRPRNGRCRCSSGNFLVTMYAPPGMDREGERNTV